jgi:hypothetical protein
VKVSDQGTALDLNHAQVVAVIIGVTGILGAANHGAGTGLICRIYILRESGDRTGENDRSA